MKSKRTMKIMSLGSENVNECIVSIGIQIISTGQKYYYKTSEYFNRQFLNRYRKSYGGWSSLNYLKKNSDLIEG